MVKLKNADKKLLDYYAKLQSDNKNKQGVCQQTLCDKKLRKRGGLEDSGS